MLRLYWGTSLEKGLVTNRFSPLGLLLVALLVGCNGDMVDSKLDCEAGCPDGQACVDGQCVDVAVDCTGPEDCTTPAGEHPECSSVACVANACVLAPLATVECEPQSCTDGVIYFARQCGSEGACLPPTPAVQSCNGYACDGASGTCKTTCAVPEDCAGGLPCLPSGECQAPKATGDPCNVGGECATGYCANEVCCDQACNEAAGACKSADVCTSAGACNKGYLTGDQSCAVCQTCNGSSAACVAKTSVFPDCHFKRAVMYGEPYTTTSMPPSLEFVANIKTRISQHNANVYQFNIGSSSAPKDASFLATLEYFLEQTKNDNIEVWATLANFTEACSGAGAPADKTLPSRRSYASVLFPDCANAQPEALWEDELVKWATALNTLHLSYPHLTAWVIDDFSRELASFASGDLMQSLKEHSPDLAFYPVVYFRDLFANWPEPPLGFGCAAGCCKNESCSYGPDIDCHFPNALNELQLRSEMQSVLSYLDGVELFYRDDSAGQSSSISGGSPADCNYQGNIEGFLSLQGELAEIRTILPGKRIILGLYVSWTHAITPLVAQHRSPDVISCILDGGRAWADGIAIYMMQNAAADPTNLPNPLAAINEKFGEIASVLYSTSRDAYGDEDNRRWNVAWKAQIDLSDRSCCPDNDMCVFDSICYPNRYKGVFNFARDKYAICAGNQGHKWFDADGGQSQCAELNERFPGLTHWSKPGEASVGEYGSVNDGGSASNGGYECCGDDAGEYFITDGEISACCNSPTDTLDALGNCVE